MQGGIHVVLYQVMMPSFKADDQGPSGRPGAVGPTGAPAKLPYCPVDKGAGGTVVAHMSFTTVTRVRFRLRAVI